MVMPPSNASIRIFSDTIDNTKCSTVTVLQLLYRYSINRSTVTISTIDIGNAKGPQVHGPGPTWSFQRASLANTIAIGNTNGIDTVLVQ